MVVLYVRLCVCVCVCVCVCTLGLRYTLNELTEVYFLLLDYGLKAQSGLFCLHDCVRLRLDASRGEEGSFCPVDIVE